MLHALVGKGGKQGRRICAVRSVIILLLFLFQWRIAHAVKQFQVHSIDLPEAYRNQYISLATEDERGMLWFVTNSGLHRYDGNEVLTFDMQSKPALPGIKIQCLLADEHNRLWIGCRNDLLCFDLTTWKLTTIAFKDANGQNVPEHLATVLFEGREGMVYAGTNNSRLYHFQENQFQLSADISETSGTVGNIPSITSMSESDDHHLWLGTNTGFLVTLPSKGGLNRKQSAYAPKAFQKDQITFIQSTANDNCLVHAERAGNFLFNYKTGRIVQIGVPTDLPQIKSNFIIPAAISEHEVLYFFIRTEQSGMGFYDSSCTNTLKPTVAASLMTFKNGLFKIAGYKHGHLLLICEKGIVTVSKFHNPIDVFLTGIDQMNSVRTIFKDHHNTLLVSTYRENLLQLDERTGTKLLRADRMVECAMAWKKDALLIGCPSPNWYFPATNKFLPVFNKPADLANQSTWNINCLTREDDSLVWAGTYSGAYLFNPSTGVRVKHAGNGNDQFLLQKGVTCITRTGSRNFFGTHDGVFWCRNHDLNFHTFFADKYSSYNHASINCIQSFDGELWMGTNGQGILVCDTAGHVKRTVGKSEGLADNVVYSLPYSKGIMLAGTGNGLSMIDLGTRAIRNYTPRQYLPNNEFNRSASLVRGDTVYMGTVNGLIRVNIAALTSYSQPDSTIHATAVSYVTDEGIRTDYTIGYRANPELIIPAMAHAFTIRVGDRNERDDEIFYSLKSGGPLEPIGRQRSVSFVGLSPGNYEINFYRRGNGNNAIRTLLSIPVVVQPRYYQTAWFRILLVALGISLVIFIIKYRERAIRKEQNLRRQIAGDLHDEIGSALTRIYLQTDALINGVDAMGNETLTALNKISVSSQEALSSMNDIVWSVDVDYDNAADLVSRMKDYLVKIREQVVLDCTFHVSGNYEHLKMEQAVRQNIFLIFREGVNNGIKHASDKRLDIQLSFDHGSFSMALTNFSSGDTLKVASGGHGLRSMKHRAEKIQSDLTTTNQAGRFRLELKIFRH